MNRETTHESRPGFRSQLELLRQHGGDIAWGDKEKGYLSFVRELNRGEAKLRYLNRKQAQALGYEEGILRESAISCIYVYAMNMRFQLIELMQQFKNGHTLPRGFEWVTEKSVFGETAEDTAYRGLRQELGLNIQEIDLSLPPETRRLRFRRKIFRKDSADTYPGLQSRMTASDYEIHLTDHEFETNKVLLPTGELVHGFAEAQEDKTTYFTFVETH